jgi:AcrR family transcriptional regulator
VASTERSETEREIMEATFRVLADVGYSDLSVRRIADEFDGSQSLIYYHYDDKEDLLAGFLGYLRDVFETKIDAIEADDPADRLSALVDLTVPAPDEPEHLPFQQALEGIRTQTPYNERYRDLFDEIDATLRREVAATIRRGVETGTFAGVDPDDAADRLVLLLYGINSRHVLMRDWDGIERGQALVEAEIDAWRAD